MGKKLLSQRHPFFYFLSIWEKRIKRTIKWQFDDKNYTSEFSFSKLDFRIKKHQSN